MPTGIKWVVAVTLFCAPAGRLSGTLVDLAAMTRPDAYGGSLSALDHPLLSRSVANRAWNEPWADASVFQMAKFSRMDASPSRNRFETWLAQVQRVTETNPLVGARGTLAPVVTVLFTYDFPGGAGTGAAGSQTNGQPAGATFGDFTRNVVTVEGTGNVFDSSNWATTATIDLTRFVTFGVTANAGNVLDLSQLTFSAGRNNGGPSLMQVSLFLNGSATAYASEVFNAPLADDGTGGVNPAAFTPFTFDFADLTAADNVTSAVFRFYGWDSASTSRHLAFDNVATLGAIEAVPEARTWIFSLLPVGLILITLRRSKPVRFFRSKLSRGRSKTPPSPARDPSSAPLPRK